MRFPLVLVVSLSAAAVTGSIGAQADQTPPSGPGALASVYKLVDWPAPATSAAGFPAAWNLIQASSVAVTARGTVLVLHRGAHPILEFESDGKFLRSWGDGLISEGKVAAIPQMNWSPDRSRYSAVYGPPGCTSCGAHSIRVDPQDNVWVVDATGHVVYKMSRDGKELMRLGTKGVSGTSTSTFNLPTDVAFAANGDIYVTDRDNQRVEVFDPNGKFVSEWKTTGGVSAMAIVRDQGIWTGSVLRGFDGSVLGSLPDVAGAHGAAVDAAGNVYLAQLTGIVQKFIKR